MYKFKNSVEGGGGWLVGEGWWMNLRIQIVNSQPFVEIVNLHT